MDVIDENEAHFLSSLQRGSRLIQRTLNRKDCKDGVFPGQSPGGTCLVGRNREGAESWQNLNPCLCVCMCVPASVAWSLHRDLGFPLDLVDLMLEDTGVHVDHQELDRLMEEHRQVKTYRHAPQL